MIRPISCREAVEELWAFLDGELPPDQAERVLNHLEQCRNCWPHYDFQRAFRDFLRARPGAAAPAELRARVLAELIADETAEA